MSPILGHLGRGKPGLWAALLVAAPTPAWAEAVSINIDPDTGRMVVLSALAAGADAYCMKDIKIDLLSQVIEMVCQGAVWLDPAIARLVMGALPGLPGAQASKEAEKQPPRRRQYNADLTEREREVLQHIVDGKSNKEIAQLLNVTTHTAKAHVCNIIQKLAVDDRTQAAVKALREGMVAISES